MILLNMKKDWKQIKYFFLTLTLLHVKQICLSQDTTNTRIKFDTTWYSPTITAPVFSKISDYSISHYPSKEDSILCKKYSKLISGRPTKWNHSNYYNLACSLWQLEKLTESEKMFLTIMNSEEPYYVGPYYYSSDIPGDTTTNIYGYSSYTTNYKNNACIYLAKIFIEQKKFEQALKYVQRADKKYIVKHTCGTGRMWYRREIDGLYAIAYGGLRMNDSILNLLLPNYSNHSNGVLTNTIKKIYSQTQINDHSKIAENSIVCVVDTFQSSTFLTYNFREKNEETMEIKYTSGTATMNLFGIQVELPRPSLKNGEIVTREHFVNEFKESGFYIALIDQE